MRLANGQGGVLVQLGEDISVEPHHCQVRVCLTVKEADHMIELLQQARQKAVEHEGQKQAETRTPEAVDVSGMQGVDGKG